MSVFVRIVKYNCNQVVIKNCVEYFSYQEDRDEKRHKCMCVGLMYVRKYVYLCMNVVCL